VEKRALDPEAEIEKLDPSVAKSLCPDEQLLKAAKDELKSVASAFPLQVVEKAAKKKKRHWREFLADDVDAKVADEDDDMAKAKKLKSVAAAGEDVKLDKIVANEVDNISSADPVSDLLAMASRKDDPKIITRAISQMLEMIRNLVQNSYGTSDYPKAIECLKALRDVCVTNDESEDFNSGMENLAKSFKSRKSFWDMVIAESLRPIDDTECGGSKYTKAQADEFLAANKDEPEASAPAEPEAEEDDIFDSME